MSKEIEKTAKEIVEKYKAITGYAHPSNTCETAKQCAILHCDGIIIELAQCYDNLEQQVYWQSIKEAIQNL
jgi:hypothetical protein